MNRSPRFSLRTMGLLVAVVAVGLGWLASWERVAREKRLAVAAIRLPGGEVSWDIQRALPPPPPTLAPKWLIKALGPEYFGHVYSVKTAKATDEQLAYLISLNLIETLDVHGSCISDEGLSRLSHLRRLKDLRLTGLDVSTSGLGHLQESQSLEILWLIDTNVTGQHLRQLSGIASMHWLIVEDDDFTDEDLLHLRDAKQLRCIQLGQTKVTESAVLNLARYLPDCSISVGAGYFAFGPDGRSQTYFSVIPGEGLIR